MPLHVIQSEITQMKVDAIVNSANQTLLKGHHRGLNGIIHQAAGPQLQAECEQLGGCETGSAKITKGYHLPAKYIIHAVGPRWQGGKRGEREQLISCYRSALELTKEANCETVAFPLISSGIYRYPKEEAFRIAVDTIHKFLTENNMTVYLVLHERKYEDMEMLMQLADEYRHEGKVCEEVELTVSDHAAILLQQAMAYYDTMLAEQLKGRIRFDCSARDNQDINFYIYVDDECWLVTDEEAYNKAGMEYYDMLGLNDLDFTFWYQGVCYASRFGHIGIGIAMDVLKEYCDGNLCMEYSLNSENYFLKLLAVWDKRTGKRRIQALLDTIDSEPEWFQKFVLLRAEGEGLHRPRQQEGF